jgi:hypothetical protein
MYGQPDRIEQFTAEIAELRVPEPSAPRDRLLARLGLVVMVAGVAIAGFAYLHSHGTTNPLQQRDAITIGLAGVALTVAGGSVYLRAALAGFLRFWLLRDLHERRAQTDRLLAGIARSQEPGATPEKPQSMEASQ